MRRMFQSVALGFGLVTGTHIAAHAQEAFASWPPLTSTFPSTSGGGVMIKGYDPVIIGAKCITTFMAVIPGEPQQVAASIIEFEAVPAQGGTLCTNGKWRSFDGTSSGTTPFRVFHKDGVFRAGS